MIKIANKISVEDFEALMMGDEEAFQRAMWATYPQVKCYMKKIVKSELDAEELTQDVFVKLWQSYTLIESVDKFSAYTFTIAHNTAMSYLRKHAPIMVEIDEKVMKNEFAPDIQEKHCAEEMMLIVSMIVAQMPSQQKKVYEMSRCEGMKIDEIAEKLNISPRTVKNHLGIALGKIKYALLMTITGFFVMIYSLV